ncbi:molybdopterin-dependent oxidoreductase [Amycolatopsis anabasis]|uniref:molybdopterin-dependent oxidoreductase n=1 Tax=Amycolatopsis anabasis TaxID=1840409 RepID=UPI001FEA047E|nr:molybdopterin-dependent oxidoreductase [Amycolatopsis anabasis]
MSTEVTGKTACILCAANCGVEITARDRRFVRIRGDKEHPHSAGYTCEKALRLDHYQNGRDRLTSPLRRRPDGGYEEIDWDTAIAEIAERLARVRDVHGGDKIFYYGGGAQGNHLGGSYSRALLQALGAKYRSNALAREKTGEMWVDGQLYGGHTAADLEHAEVVVLVGNNPWQSHQFPRARPWLRELAADPDRTLIVFDPRRSETAAMADFHLRVRPGTDAWCLAAMLGVLVQEDLVDHEFLDQHTTGAEPVLELLAEVPVADYAGRCGVPEDLIRAAARRIGTAGSVAEHEDLGIQQGPHSTLCSYLAKLLWILTGNFAKRGAMSLHSWLVPLASPGREGRSPVTGARIIAGYLPCNSIAEEIRTDHPERFRAMIVESANPVSSLADARRFREAMRALDLTVVVDVAFTETAREADYVLPAASQFEKWEATFFTLEFPRNAFHLRAPILEPLPGTLPEPEIHARLLRALDAVDESVLAPLRDAAEQGREKFAEAFFATVATDPGLMRMAPHILYETLGPTLPDGARAAAALWGAAHLCAMTNPDAVRRAGFAGGDELFDAILTSRSGVVFTVDDYPDTWHYVRHADRRFRLEIGELLDELRGLTGAEASWVSTDFPFVLSAGERRSFTANALYRDPAWRRRDAEGALRISPDDAERLGLDTGGRARIVTERGAAEAVVEVSDMMQPGHISLPNGYGLDYPGGDGEPVATGVALNELTSLLRRDPIAGTPWHKHVPARVEPLAATRVEVS